ncbi:hypothetical protein [Thalassomonas haliotis]|uniref:Uncharacterized protein n=1 Tax=Thalassomonas haliotis TaxID=485448 RepID=A0ABY7VHS4_9GAMM|nr:hypothetical protein [Thalassomonas haliotis]WDE12488.1 hypothetical protein H3N35_03110 [Thalassomonas haliotis]
MANVTSETNFTQQVRSLIGRTYGRSQLKDSCLDRAIIYFEHKAEQSAKADKYQQQLEEIKAKIEEGSGKESAALQQKLHKLEREQRNFQLQLRLERNERNENLLETCQKLLTLCEAEDIEETNRKSAQFLGTLQLISPTEGKKVALANEQHKALYKAVLALRLLDRLCMDKIVAEPYISQYLTDIPPEQYEQYHELDPKNYKVYIQQVKVPVIMAALLQDIGHYHPDAQQIIYGEDGKLDPCRTLDMASRKALLQISYRETVDYLVHGIGLSQYIGNSKVERDKFNQAEHKKVFFIKHLLKTSINPLKGIGNLLKVPQIYTSIILSTKGKYNYKLLPKAYQALNQNAERGTCSQAVVDSLYRITGMYPQGFGITYIPRDSDGKALDRYEYAIVNRLYPENPEQPLCRAATRQLSFISRGLDIIVKCEDNLYLSAVATSLATISKKRLMEILELLASNYKERENLELIPRCWHAGEFFSIKENQKLWNKAQ